MDTYIYTLYLHLYRHLRHLKLLVDSRAERVGRLEAGEEGLLGRRVTAYRLEADVIDDACACSYFLETLFQGMVWIVLEPSTTLMQSSEPL